MLNQIILVGRLTSLPKIIGDDYNHQNFTIEVLRPYAQANGEYLSDTFTIKAWRGVCDKIIDYCKINNLIIVKGNLYMEEKPIIYAEDVSLLN